MVARRTLPDVAILDLRLPDTRGDDLCRDLVASFPSIAVIILTTYLSEATARAAFCAGAAEYITKAAGLPSLKEALDRVHEGPIRGGEGRARAVVQELHAAESSRAVVDTTPQQQQVLELVAAGMTYKEVGAQLYITESTVRFHIQNLKGKFDARTKTELVARAIRLGVISPAPEDQRAPWPLPEELRRQF